MKKYEFTGEIKIFNGVKLNRIVSLIDFNNVKKGDIGGWLEKEYNLSNEGSSWVYEDANVFEYARVQGNAKISGESMVFGNAMVQGNARVYGNACIQGDARVSGNACIEGNARVSGESMVIGNAMLQGSAKVSGNACIQGNAKVSGNAKIYNIDSIISIDNVGSERGTITAFITEDGFMVNRGCFNGTLEEFEKKVEIVHEGSEYFKEYKIIIELIKHKLKVN